MCGTPNFISPEVATRSSHGLEADVWGLGCLLYTLLVGTPPFDTHGVKNTLNRIVTVNYHLPEHLSIQAKDLINSLLQKDPHDRLKLDDILNHPFIKRGQLLTSHLTQDSGIHTMSSRRESAFSDTQYYPQPYRKVNSDCMPSTNHIQIGRLTHSLEHITKNLSQCDSVRKSQCSCHDDQYPSDPGGVVLKAITNNQQKDERPPPQPPKSQRLLQLCSQRLLPKTHRTENSILHIWRTVKLWWN